MLETIGGAFTGIIAIIIVLGACVFFHELGHFAVAKIIGMRVHEFAMGFGYRLLGFTIGETDYRVNLVPLGGYVRIAGMEPGAEPEERGFYMYPRWKGATVLLAGSFMNVVLAALAFIAVALAAGLPVFPGNRVEITRVIPNSPAREAGIRAGDEIIAIDGMKHSLLIADVEPDGVAQELNLSRYDRFHRINGDEVDTVLDLVQAMIEGYPVAEADMVRFSEDGAPEARETVALHMPDDLPSEVSAAEAGPLLEDALDLTLVRMGTQEALAYISARPEQEITLTILRDGDQMELSVVPAQEWARVPVQENGRMTSAHQQVGRIGVVLGAPTRPAGGLEAVSHGIRGSVGAVAMVVEGIAMMIRRQVALEAAGPVGIAAMTADRARIGWTAVASLGGIISANLAVINLFPIPPFDGFRIVLLGVEGVLRRRVSERVELGLTIAGVALLLGLFLIITFRDIFHLVLFQTP